MADITHPPTPDDLTVRATASLQAMHDRVVAEGGIDPLTNVILIFIRAIIAYLAIPLQHAITPIAVPTPVPESGTTSLSPRAHASHARRQDTHARRRHAGTRRSIRAGIRAHRSHPPLHPTTANLIPAQHCPNLRKIVPPH